MLIRKICRLAHKIVCSRRIRRPLLGVDGILSGGMDTFGWYSYAVDGRDVAAAMALSETLAEYTPSDEK